MTSNASTAFTLPVRVAFTSPEAAALYDGAPAPATPVSAGTDLRAAIAEEEIVLAPGARCKVPTGLRVQPCLPGWAALVCSRSGLGAKDGVTVAQGVGLVDPDYTGEVIVFLLNTSGEVRRIGRGERVAQLIFLPYAHPDFQVAADLDPTLRGAGGFGHTGR
ncbi:MAG: dUTP diphosphatase [Desulfovibrionaceae bacterium]|nr:dUTP diphosphatase [Desulfovibrionaceae bacterium]